MKTFWTLAIAVAAISPSPHLPTSASEVPAGTVLVCIQDDAKIAVVNMPDARLVRTIDLQALGFPATAKPHYIVVEPDRRHWYVSLIGANTVAKFDANDKIVGKFEMETPGMLALGPGNQLVVTRSMSAVNPPKRIAIIDRTTMTGTEVDVVFPRPHPVAVAAGFAYSGSLGTNQIASVNLQTERVALQTVDGPTHAFVQFAVSPDGKTLVAATEVSGQLLVFDISDPAKPVFKTSVEIGKMAFDPVFTPDGRTVWVPAKMDNTIAIVEVRTWTVIRRVKSDAFKQPHQVVFAPDGRSAFVTNNNKMDHMADPAHAGHSTPGADDTASLVMVDVDTGKTITRLPLGKNLTGMGAAR